MKRKIKLQRATDGEFDPIFDALERSFVPEERRERDDAQRLMAEGAYTAYHIIDGDIRVGVMTVWELEGFAYVEHFFTYPEFRNKGYGGEALSCIKEKYETVVLEAEPPRDELTKRRVSFYERNGFRKNERYYFQPAYRKGGNGVELVLMSWPELLHDFDRTATEIYRRVYGKEYGGR